MARPNPLDNFHVDKGAVQFVGENLNRPECILSQKDGSLWTSDARGGVMHIAPGGRQRIVAPNSGESAGEKSVKSLSSGTLPNGIALANDGSVIIANLGLFRLERLTQDGKLSVLLDQIEGRPLGQVNFVVRDSRNRFWVSISTRVDDWMDAMRPDVSDGYIGIFEDGQFRVVADGFHYTNEIRLDANEEWLYISETCGPYVSRMRIAEDGSLSRREIFGPSKHGGLLDGIAFDAFGNLWGTHVMADRIFAITPEGDLRILLDDGDPDLSAKLMNAFWSKTLTAEQMMRTKGTLAPWTTGITFGGPDLQTVHVASVLATEIPTFRSPVAGLPLQHWAR